MHVECAAAVAAAPGERDPEARSSEHADDRGVHRSHPRIHHAPGEQPHVVARGLERLWANRQTRHAEPGCNPLRNHVSALRNGEHP